jgi:hypothetical protein
MIGPSATAGSHRTHVTALASCLNRAAGYLKALLTCADYTMYKIVHPLPLTLNLASWAPRRSGERSGRVPLREFRAAGTTAPLMQPVGRAGALGGWGQDAMKRRKLWCE